MAVATTLGMALILSIMAPFASATAPTPGGQLEKALEVVTAHGFEGLRTGVTGFDSPNSLKVIVAVERTVGASHPPSQAFFFFRNRYLGTDTRETSDSVSLASASPTTVALRYELWRPSDAHCCPTGTATVRFHWDGSALVRLDPMPSDSSRYASPPAPPVPDPGNPRNLPVTPALEAQLRAAFCSTNTCPKRPVPNTTYYGSDGPRVFAFTSFTGRRSSPESLIPQVFERVNGQWFWKGPFDGYICVTVIPRSLLVAWHLHRVGECFKAYR